MPVPDDLLQTISEMSKGEFHDRQSILSFSSFLERVTTNPQKLIRNAPTYIRDAFDFYGEHNIGDRRNPLIRWKLFDMGTEKHVPIIGSEDVQNEIYRTLNTFVRQGFSNKLIVLHGPNGSAKTSMIESITHAMNRYSKTEDGAVYRFNWIFPTEKFATPQSYGEAGPLGFGKRNGSRQPQQTFAHLEESKIAAKINSEFKENPIFLIPMPHREEWLKKTISDAEGIPIDDVELPPHVLLSGLSKRNQEIMDHLVAAYDGDYNQVLRHVQVERFFYSRQYRIGISTVEPQMSIDAAEKQLTMDRSIANLPTVLQNISFHEAIGPLVEANRGVLEYSDLLKRPVEAYKYLLSTVEKSTINLPSSTANLDTVFFATTNEKHLDAFKTLPDFASFRSRFELITVPYLLKATDEEKIYIADGKILEGTKPICPHSIFLLSLWAVLTRLKQPNPEYYDSKFRSLIARLDPFNKSKLYEARSLSPTFKQQEEITFKELREQILNESRGVIVYEGRFGASPRELKSILYRAAQNTRHKTLTPMCIFEELENITKDRSVYEFLQLEPKGKYHQPTEFIKVLKHLFAETFEREASLSMTLVEEGEYGNLLERYVDNVVAAVKKEKIYNRITGSHEDPNQKLMNEVEEILKITGSVERHRENLLGKIAAYRIDHPNKNIHINEVFEDHLRAIQEHYHSERKLLVDENFKCMLTVGTDDETSLSEQQVKRANSTFKELENRYGYDHDSARACLKFLMANQPKA